MLAVVSTMLKGATRLGSAIRPPEMESITFLLYYVKPEDVISVVKQGTVA